MVRGQRAEGWSPAGSGFALAGDAVLTANHVVRDRPAAEVMVWTDGDDGYRVDAVVGSAVLDVAVLHLPVAPPSSWRVGDAEAGARWLVTSRPRDNDPQLTGVVSALDRLIVNDGGHRVEVLQLAVDQPLEEYRGYSGSAVRLRHAPATVIGVLCEQVRSRLVVGRGERRPATNVLYAVPMIRVAREFGLGVTAGMPAATVQRVRSLLREGRVAEADRLLQGSPDGSLWMVDHWYWKARVALAGDNLTVALAYADRALASNGRHVPSVALKIRVLLLLNTAEGRLDARRLSADSRQLDGSLDLWLDCLDRRGMFDARLRTPTELDSTCPLPDDIA
jgi:hypothetical protein